jgi:hypothetical protein
MKYDLNGKPWKSYGNTGTPITMNMGGWRITYHMDSEVKTAFFCEATLMNAVAVFNSLDRTTGFDAGTLTIDRIDTFGNLTDTYTQEGRYGIPHSVRSVRHSDTRRKKRAYVLEDTRRLRRTRRASNGN